MSRVLIGRKPLVHKGLREYLSEHARTLPKLRDPTREKRTLSGALTRSIRLLVVLETGLDDEPIVEPDDGFDDDSDDSHGLVLSFATDYIVARIGPIVK